MASGCCDPSALTSLVFLLPWPAQWALFLTLPIFYCNLVWKSIPKSARGATTDHRKVVVNDAARPRTLSGGQGAWQNDPHMVDTQNLLSSAIETIGCSVAFLRTIVTPGRLPAFRLAVKGMVWGGDGSEGGKKRPPQVSPITSLETHCPGATSAHRNPT